jgi:hypothetical protein
MYFECSQCWIVIEAARAPERCPSCVGAHHAFVGVERARLQLHLLARRFQRELMQGSAVLGRTSC